MRTWYAASLVLLLGLAVAWADDPPKKEAPKDYKAGNAMEQLQALQREYQAETQKLQQAQVELRSKFARRHVELAEQHPKDPAAVSALLWVVRFAPNSPESNKAFGLLADHAESGDVASLLTTPNFIGRSTEAVKFLRAVAEKNPKEDVKGLASYQLAMQLKNQGERGDEQASKEAEKLFEEVSDKYASVKSGNSTLGALAKNELTELKSAIRVGAPIPEIDGEDLDGVKFKISDYKGKVVLLDFWGHW